MKLNVSEIFYSLQGEGQRAGTRNIFIRLQGCKTKNACFASGVKCDTEFESGREYSIDELLDTIEEYQCVNIIWTGGEPADQLTPEIVQVFSDHGYYQAIETSGLLPVPSNLDYITVSPKVAEHVVAKNFDHINELRYVRHKGQELPEPSITADSYYLSPHSNGMEIDLDNLNHCIGLIKTNASDKPWALSLQMHKIWSVL